MCISNFKRQLYVQRKPNKKYSQSTNQSIFGVVAGRCLEQKKLTPELWTLPMGILEAYHASLEAHPEAMHCPKSSAYFREIPRSVYGTKSPDR
jgi:hypothetical protein